MASTSETAIGFAVATSADNGCRTMMCQPSSVPAASHNSHRAISYARLGAGHLARRELVAAISAYSQAILLDASSVESFLGRASAFIAVSSFDLGLRDVSRAISLKRDSAEALSLRAELYRRLLSVDSNRADVLLPLALEDVSEAIRIDPGYAPAQEVRSRLYASVGADELHRYRRACANVHLHGSRRPAPIGQGGLP